MPDGRTSSWWRGPSCRKRRSAAAGVPPRIAPEAGRQWLDYLHDVTVADEIALAEGYEHIEHLKRYTTCGMAADQGKTSGLNALLAVAEMTAKSPPRSARRPVRLHAGHAGRTRGRQLGARYSPKRLLPAHVEHEALARIAGG